jgi:hypothetical protein
MKTSLLIMVLLAAVHSCKKSESVDIPACMGARIAQFDSTISLDSVVKYRFHDKDVYLFNHSQCCDIGSPIYDSECNVICTMGGFIGNTNCEGENFESNAVLIGTVWRK